MITLRLSQMGPLDGGTYPIEVALEGLGARRTATARMKPVWQESDQASIRWYLEKYPEKNAPPAPTVAAGIERRMAEIGRTLFSEIFESNRDTMRLWSDVADRLSDTRVEVSTSIRETHAFPWELLRDPRTDAPLALNAAEFVHVQSQTGRAPRIGAPEDGGPTRILVAICRPDGAQDVSFRSVAMRIVKALTDMGEKAIQLEVLRPPTFAEFGRKLRAAKASGKPYHAVHFDGHGLYLDNSNLVELERQQTYEPHRLAAPPAANAARGYICFEHESLPGRIQPVDGTTLGNLLYETDVSTLVLNACRSAQGEGIAAALESEGGAGEARVAEPLTQEDQVRAYGSFAQAVVDTGVGGVVAMRYNVYVVTAAQFVGELYEALVQGRSLGRAATLARKHLNDDRQRAVAAQPVDLQDWQVPAIYEAAPIRLFAPRAMDQPLFDIGSIVTGSNLPEELPRTPDAGFVGRDETLLAIDRAFDHHPIVLMHAFAGSGKTTTAAEFARWYATTGGVRGPILFDSFEQYISLPRLVDRICAAMSPILKQQGIEWLVMDDPARKQLALAVLGKIPMFWIWDNAEQVAGFPSGAESAWSAAEQKDLANFLRDLAKTKAKVLLTSRRDEAAWLGDLPLRVPVPPMPRPDRVQLGMALIRQRGGDVRTISALEPLLDFSAGNPMTLGVVIRQALREGIATVEAAARLVDQLRNGEKSFDDDQEQGRSRSLGASLAYGFANAFDDDERRRLALLHLFQGRVMAFVTSILQMRMERQTANPEAHRRITEQWSILLSRAAEVGLLTALSRRSFDAHPALSWFFRSLFDRYYPTVPEGDAPSAAWAEECFAATIVEVARSIDARGDSNIEFAALQAEEANLRHARRLAEQRGWWHLYIGATTCLLNHYRASGRSAELDRMSRATIERLIDPQTFESRPGLEALWFDAMAIAHSVAIRAFQPDEAERVFAAMATRAHQELGDFKTVVRERLSETQFKAAQGYLYTARLHFGNVVMLLGKDEIAKALELGDEAFDLALRLKLDVEASAIAFHLGHCHFELRRPTRLADAEAWYRLALKHGNPKDILHRIMIEFELVQITYARFQEARTSERDRRRLLEILNQALEAAQKLRAAAPEIFPSVHLRINHLLGNILDDGGVVSGNPDYHHRAQEHYATALQIADRLGEKLDASKLCREMARSKLHTHAFDEAIIYAENAVQRAVAVGPGGAHAADASRKLLADIKELRNKAGNQT